MELRRILLVEVRGKQVRIYPDPDFKQSDYRPTREMLLHDGDRVEVTENLELPLLVVSSKEREDD